ncbi:LysR family transcriptional regulator [Rhodococcus opacus]|nr:LysR family transcriptional regulator [Rhodococcus opacus]CAG7641199.1 HTH-type transcriptional activator CmpR [Rhodococcus opacus]
MRTFVVVADQGSVRGAAAQLHVSEPAVSAAMTHIQKQLGVSLLAKTGRGIRLTDAGQVYAGYCRTILGLLDEAPAAVQKAEEGRLRIGAVATASEYVLLRPLASFRRRYPDIDLTLSVLPRDELFLELQYHETDLVIAGRPPRDSGLVIRARRPSSLVVVGSPGRFPDPAVATWLLRGHGSGTRDTTLSLLDQLQISPPTLTLGTHGTVLAAAREGLGVTLVHADAIERDRQKGLLEVLAVEGTPLDRPWHVITTKTPTPTARLFVRHITDQEEVGAAAAFHPKNPPSG